LQLPSFADNQRIISYFTGKKITTDQQKSGSTIFKIGIKRF